MLSFIFAVSNNYQYHRLLSVIIKGYDFKGATLLIFDSTDAIYQAGKDVVGRETPTMKPTTQLFCVLKGTFKRKLSQ